MDLSSDLFPMRLREVREARGLSQSELAKKAGMQPSAVSHFETGRRKAPSLDNLRKLADALEVSTDYLIGRSSEMTSAGPVADKLFRQLGKMSEESRKTFEKMAAMLSEDDDDD